MECEVSKYRLRKKFPPTGGAVRLPLRTAVSGHSAGMTIDTLIRQARQVIRDEIRRTYTEGLKRQADVLNLLEPVCRNDYPLYRKLTGGGRFPLDESSLRNIDVTVAIASTGKTKDSFRVK